MRRLWLDDIRTPPTLDWVWVKGYQEAVDYIRGYGLPDIISFDHDLGDRVPTGHDLAKWIVNSDLDGSINISNQWRYVVHSANPVGRANIKGLLDGYLSAKFQS